MEDQKSKISEITERFWDLQIEKQQLKEDYNIEKKRAEKLEEVMKFQDTKMRDQKSKISEITKRFCNLQMEHQQLKEEHNIEKKRAEKLEEVIKLQDTKMEDQKSKISEITVKFYNFQMEYQQLKEEHNLEKNRAEKLEEVIKFQDTKMESQSSIVENYNLLLKEHQQLKEEHNIEKKRADKLEEVIKLNYNGINGNNGQAPTNKKDFEDATKTLQTSTLCVQILPVAPTKKYATHYNMNHVKRGKAIIFNHENFKNKYAERRDGTNVDCKDLKFVLEELGFEVTDYHDPTSSEIHEILKCAASMDHSQHDCLAVAFLTHGDLGLLSAYDTPYKADAIWSYFTSDKCPTLAGKPKLFFIQACQGKRYDDGTLLEEKTETDGLVDTTTTFRIPINADFLIAYSTIPGYYSWRNTASGSWFIQALCMELRENGTRYDILTLLTFVSQRVALDFKFYTSENINVHQRKQIPYITSMLTRLVKFPALSNIAPPKTNAIANSK